MKIVTGILLIRIWARLSAPMKLNTFGIYMDIYIYIYIYYIYIYMAYISYVQETDL